MGPDCVRVLRDCDSLLSVRTGAGAPQPEFLSTVVAGQGGIMKDSIRQTVSDSAKLCGFHLAGITSILDEEEMPELGHLEEWFADGRAGEMEYLKRRDPEGRLLRSSIQVPFPWVRSVIVCAVNYNSDQPYSIDSPGDAEKGWIARYAWSGQRPALEAGSGSHFKLL
jgi:hypothetical protein